MKFKSILLDIVSSLKQVPLSSPGRTKRARTSRRSKGCAMPEGTDARGLVMWPFLVGPTREQGGGDFLQPDLYVQYILVFVTLATLRLDAFGTATLGKALWRIKPRRQRSSLFPLTSFSVFFFFFFNFKQSPNAKVPQVLVKKKQIPGRPHGSCIAIHRPRLQDRKRREIRKDRKRQHSPTLGPFPFCNELVLTILNAPS